MKITLDVLRLLEGDDEETQTNRLKSFLNLHSDRAARILLNILHHSPDKWTDKIAKEIKKMELKKLKEYKKMQKRMDSYNFPIGENNHSKLGKLNAEIDEFKSLLS